MSRDLAADQSFSNKYLNVFWLHQAVCCQFFFNLNKLSCDSQLFRWDRVVRYHPCK